VPFHFRSVRRSIVAASEGVAIRRQQRWPDRVGAYLCHPSASRSFGPLATAMNPSLPFDAPLAAPVVSSPLGTAQACEVGFPHTLARRTPSANHSVKRDGLTAAPYLKR